MIITGNTEDKRISFQSKSYCLVVKMSVECFPKSEMAACI
jgi:hypothetical protein